jgi:hypothetical protein
VATLNPNFGEWLLKGNVSVSVVVFPVVKDNHRTDVFFRVHTAPCVTFESRSLLRVFRFGHAHCSVCYICVRITAPCVTFVSRSTRTAVPSLSDLLAAISTTTFCVVLSKCRIQSDSVMTTVVGSTQFRWRGSGGAGGGALL